jgi:NAD-dependent deacetylase
MSSNVEAARAAIGRANRIAVLTGAGVSAESGIPTFRSNGGFWQTHRFEELATLEGFSRNPKMVWEWYEERRRGIAAAGPNPGHFALARLETQLETTKGAFTLITQNVDNLHHRAGSRNVLRLHGDIFAIRCMNCGRERVETNPLHELPPKCQCGGMMRPGVVWFGEMLADGAIEKASAAVRQSDVFLVAGTSAQVYPAAGLIPLALENRATVIEVNPEDTDFSDDVTIVLRGTSADLLPQLL